MRVELEENRVLEVGDDIPEGVHLVERVVERRIIKVHE